MNERKKEREKERERNQFLSSSPKFLEEKRKERLMKSG